MFRTNLSAVSPEGPVVVSLHERLDLVDATAVATIRKALAAPDLWIIANLLAAPQPQVRFVHSLIWEADSSGVQTSMAAAAASAESRPSIGLALPSSGSR